ncbi:DUF1799 domain-containing protein [Marivita sp.]|uniref:DUF1799 domain-containing protein n=1 Tax=Marivita sp. TaxID=2003365 RepID=UPI003F720746
MKWAGGAWTDGSLAHDPDGPKRGAARDAELWGIPWREPETGVWPENAEAVRAFLRIQSLFRFPGAFGGTCGLEYGGVRDGLEMAGFEITPELWAQLQCVERGAIDATIRKLSR